MVAVWLLRAAVWFGSPEMSRVTRIRHVGIASGAILVVIAGLAEVVVGFKDSYLLGLVFLGAEILGRIYLVLAGILPLKGGDAVKFVLGGVTALAAISACMVAAKKAGRGV